jgi:hypothetical protein
MGREDQQPGIGRRKFLQRTAAITAGSVGARGLYELIDEMDGRPQRAAAATVVRRFQEQYLIDQIEVIMNNNVTVAIPPIHNDVFTAKLKSNLTTAAALKNAKTRVENAVTAVEGSLPSTAKGLTIVIGWGLPYFRTFLDGLWQNYLPAIPGSNPKAYAVHDVDEFGTPPGRTSPFPSDPGDVVMEHNHVMFKFRSDSSSIVATAEDRLFKPGKDPNTYIGDLFDLTSKRMGFLGRGFGTQSFGKGLAKAANIPGADKIPDDAQLLMGFTSTQTQALGPTNLPSFETLRGVTDQWPNGYFAAGCAMHLSHLKINLQDWYGLTYDERAQRMFSPRVQPNGTPVTVPNGPAQISTMDQVKADAQKGLLGHNALLQQAARLGAVTYDNYGRRWPQGTSVPLREDFNTLDNPFFWYANGTPSGASPAPNQPGMHFVAFLPGHHLFHKARMAMDGVMPDGTNFRGSVSDQNMGINSRMHATHRQNYVIPPRRNRSFPLVEFLK